MAGYHACLQCFYLNFRKITAKISSVRKLRDFMVLKQNVLNCQLIFYFRFIGILESSLQFIVPNCQLILLFRFIAILDSVLQFIVPAWEFSIGSYSSLEVRL